MNNLLLRFLTAAIGAILTLSVIYYTPYGLLLFAALISLLGLWEFLRISGTKKRYKISSMIWGIIMLGIILIEIMADRLMEIPRESIWVWMFCLLPITGMVALFDTKSERPDLSLQSVIFGAFYAFVPFILFCRICIPTIAADYMWQLPLGLLMLTWSLDVGAYFAGRFLGKRPLFPRHSPKKTWEGAIGGGLTCLGMAWLFQSYLPIPDLNWFGPAAIIVIFNQYGDLMESLIKRKMELKDSGSILPGHGGILDRFDGFYFSMPFLYLYFFFT